LLRNQGEFLRAAGNSLGNEYPVSHSQLLVVCSKDYSVRPGKKYTQQSSNELSGGTA
jgi:hypothetical protein